MTNTRTLDWPERIEKIIGNPDLLDRFGSSELKQIGKKLAQTVINVGYRATVAERKAELLEKQIASAHGVEELPRWSYMHRDEVMRACDFTGFHLVKDDHAQVVCGEEAGTLYPLYEYDFEDFGFTDAEKRAQTMVAHLRHCFTPRPTQPKTQEET